MKKCNWDLNKETNKIKQTWSEHKNFKTYWLRHTYCIAPNLPEVHVNELNIPVSFIAPALLGSEDR